MPSTYVHLSGKETDDALLKLNGIQPQQVNDQESKLRPHICTRCDTINDPAAQFCRKCGLPTNATISVQVEDKKREEEHALAEVLQDEGVRRAVQKALLRKQLRARAV